MATDFWNDEEEVNGFTPEQDEGKKFETIPEGTNVDFEVESIKWKDPSPRSTDKGRFIEATWVIFSDNWKKRKIFHKMRVLCNDSGKTDEQNEKKAKKDTTHLRAIDFIGGGKIAKGRGKTWNSVHDLTDDVLSKALVGVRMSGKLGVHSEGTEFEGNYVMSLSPIDKDKKVEKPVQKKPEIDDIDEDSDIPF